MANRAVFDAAVIQEWKRRNDEYRSRTRWLRLPFYLGMLLLVPAYMFLPARFAPAFIALEIVNFLFVGVLLSKYSFSSLKCPHCEKQPFNPYRKNVQKDSCRECGYWLKEYRESFLNGGATVGSDQTRE